MGQLGAQTSETVRETRNIIIGKYERLIDRAKKNGEFKDDISTQLAAFYINEQIANAMIQQKRGERAEDIRDNLKLALSVFI